jgi:hypothetical protein
MHCELPFLKLVMQIRYWLLRCRPPHTPRRADRARSGIAASINNSAATGNAFITRLSGL